MNELSNDVLTTQQVASLLQVSEWHIYNLCNHKKIPHKRIGRLLRFSKSAILQWIDGKK